MVTLYDNSCMVKLIESAKDFYLVADLLLLQRKGREFLV